MKKILFPTDFSETAANAFIYALQLAEHSKAEVITLHAYQLPKGNYLNYYDYMTGAVEVLDLEAFENYRNDIPQLRKIAEEHNLGHIQVSHVIDKNDVVTAINDIIQKDKVDYVVMGTKGITDAKGIFLGSVTEKVIAKATVPVMVIPKSSRYRPIKNIMFSTKFHSGDISVLESLVKLAESFNAKIDCVYVKKIDEDVTKNQAYQAFNDYFFEECVSIKLLDGSDVEETLLQFAQTHHIDLMAMSPEKKSFFEKLFSTSLTERMVFDADIPLLVLPKQQ